MYVDNIRIATEIKTISVLKILNKSDIKRSKIEESILEKKSEKDGEYF